MKDHRNVSGSDQAQAGAAPSQTRLWMARKNGRHAELWARVHPEGLELRCFVNDSLLWKDVYPLGSRRALSTVVDEHRDTWIAKGWAVTE